jgi:hypothetical protein
VNPTLRAWLIALAVTWTVLGLLVILNVVVADGFALRGVELIGR